MNPNPPSHETTHFLPPPSSSPPLPMTPSEKRSIIILILLYFIQGIPIGLFDSSIPLIFIENGVDYKALGLLSFVTYPFSLKLFFAPVEDAYFSRRVGKRKSYILPCQYLMAFVFLISASFIEDLVKNQLLTGITLLGVVSVGLASWQDIAVDGWVLTMFSETHVRWGAVCQNIGQLLGVVFGSSLFIQLNSVKFCNHYLYSEPQTEPMLRLSEFFYLCTLIILLITIYVHFFVEEKRSRSEEYEKLKLLDVVKSLKGFFQNKNLRFLIFVLLFWRLGFAGVGATSTVRLIQQGFEKETFTNIFTMTMPMSFLISLLIGKYLKKNSEMKAFTIFFLLKFLENIGSYFLVNSYSNMGSDVFLFLLIVLTLYGITVSSALFVLIGAFFSKVSDDDVGGTYLTFLNSISNMGNMWTTSFMLYIIGNNNYNLIVQLSWVYAIFFYVLYRGKIKRMDEQPKKEWMLRKEGKKEKS